LDGLGIKIDRAIVIVDRCEGAKENLKKAGLKLESIFKIKDLDV
jgi:orotate phosphoribosyltransferase